MRILIGGGGEVGYLTARRLSREGNEVTIVEQNAERCAQCHPADRRKHEPARLVIN
jgi:Trk K+ transport system NAD-binding subunit